MESGWSIEFTGSARREFKMLSLREKQSATQTLFELAEDPFPSGFVALRGYENLYRVRFYHDRFRLVYHVSEKQHKVIVTRVRPRGTAYVGMRG